MNSFLSRASGLLLEASERLRAATGWRRWLIAFFAGVAGALAMAPIYALPLLAVSLSVFVLLIDSAKTHQRPRRSAFAAGWFWGFGYFLVGLYWMALSFFVQADQFAWMAPFAMTGMPAFLALFTGLAALICAPFDKTGWARIALYAAVFAMIEYLRGHVLTGLPWNLAGQALAGSAIGAQSAAYYGAYGLSLVAVFLAMAPAAGLQGGAKPHGLSGLAVAIIGTGVLFLIGFLRLGFPLTPPSPQAYVRIVQPNIPQREKIDWDFWAKNFERQMEHSRGPKPGVADAPLYIIWPENGAPLLDEAQTALAVIGEDLPKNTVLIAGTVRRERDGADQERWYNSIAVVEQTPAGAAVTAHYDKSHLVPIGEYLPFFDFFQRIGLAALTPYQDQGFSAGPGPQTLSAGGTRFSPLICYEAIFPRASYPLDQRPDWLVVATNDAWFGDSSGPRQHLDMARLRSIETGLPMARSANTGVSALIDGKGRVLARIPLYQAGKIDAPLPQAQPRPLYDRFGDWVFFLMLLGFLGFALAPRRSARATA